jgi:hypothetical protein
MARKASFTKALRRALPDADVVINALPEGQSFLKQWRLESMQKLNVHLASLALAGLGLSSAPILAQDGNVTAADLVQYCGVTAEDPNTHTAIAFCYGYIDAALDYHHAITADGEDRIACPPGEVTRADVAAVVVEWAEIHPDDIDDNPPVHVVMRAAGEKWPCE